MGPKNYEEDSFQDAKLQDFNSKQYESYESLKNNNKQANINNGLQDEEIKKQVIQFPSNQQIIQCILQKLPEYRENIATMNEEDLRQLYLVATNAPQNTQPDENLSQDLNQSKALTQHNQNMQPVLDSNQMKKKIVQIFPDMKNQLQSFNSQEIKQIYDASFGDQNAQSTNNQNYNSNNSNANNSYKNANKSKKDQKNLKGQQIGSINDDQLQAIFNQSMTKNSYGKKLPISKAFTSNSKKIDQKNSVQVPFDYLNKKKSRASDFEEPRMMNPSNKFKLDYLGQSQPQVIRFANNVRVKKFGPQSFPSHTTYLLIHRQYQTGQPRKFQKTDKKSNCRCKCCLRRQSQSDGNSFIGFMNSLVQKYGR